MQDPLFDPFWVAEETSTPQSAQGEASAKEAAAETAPLLDPWDSAPPAERRAPRKGVRPRREKRQPPFERTLLSKVRSVATRLTGAGHHAVVDERIGRRPAGVRLLLRPSRSPLASEAPSTVLELIVEHGDFAARVWLDPLGPEPEAVRPLSHEQSDEWLDQVLVDFVALALSRA